jgi:small multidrug resistance pump
MAWLFLVATVAAEIVGALSARFSDGFTRPVPTLLVVVGVVAAYYLLSLTLRWGMPMGMAYGLWTALGVAGMAVIGVAFLGEGFTGAQVAGLACVVVGVVVLQMSDAPAEAGPAPEAAKGGAE